MRHFAVSPEQAPSAINARLLCGDELALYFIIKSRNIDIRDKPLYALKIFG